MRMKALKSMRYAGRGLKADDVFEISNPRYALILGKLGFAVPVQENEVKPMQAQPEKKEIEETPKRTYRKKDMLAETGGAGEGKPRSKKYKTREMRAEDEGDKAASK